MIPDLNSAAIKASETIIKYGIMTSPVSPITILERMDNVIVTTFSELSSFSGSDACDLYSTLGRSQGAMTSIHLRDGRAWYVVAYNNLLPYTIVQHALARELGHIVLRHKNSSPENNAEAVCFAQHLLCPRPLIHAIQATGMRLTTDVLANLTGIFHECLTCMRKTPGVSVPATVNRFIRSQFMPFIMNFFEYYTTAAPEDGSALADFGSYMDLYEE